MQYATRRIAANHQDLRLDPEPLLCLPSPQALVEATGQGAGAASSSYEPGEPGEPGAAEYSEGSSESGDSWLPGGTELLTPELLARQKVLPLDCTEPVALPGTPAVSDQPGSVAPVLAATDEVRLPGSAHEQVEPPRTGFRAWVGRLYRRVRRRWRAWVGRSYRRVRRRWRAWFGLHD